MLCDVTEDSSHFLGAVTVTSPVLVQKNATLTVTAYL